MMGSAIRSANPATAEVLAGLKRAASELPREEVPGFLAELERARTEILLAAAAGSQAPLSNGVEAPSLLTAEQVAKRLERSKWWVYKNRDALPVVRFPTGGFGFRSEALDAWIRRRSG